jgi:hypothetical protein
LAKLRSAHDNYTKEKTARRLSKKLIERISSGKELYKIGRVF